jgi:hypothetical protein
MAEAADPEPILESLKATTVDRLVRDGVPPAWVDAWIAVFEAGGLHRGRADPVAFWDDAYSFTLGEYRRGRDPF